MIELNLCITADGNSELRQQQQLNQFLSEYLGRESEDPDDQELEPAYWEHTKRSMFRERGEGKLFVLF